MYNDEDAKKDPEPTVIKYMRDASTILGEAAKLYYLKQEQEQKLKELSKTVFEINKELMSKQRQIDDLMRKIRDYMPIEDEVQCYPTDEPDPKYYGLNVKMR